MGLFDSFIIPCLFCKKEIEEQTKAGPCLLESYKWNDPFLPVFIMEDFDNVEVRCPVCKRRFRIKFDYQVIRRGCSLEPIDNLDYLELEHMKREENK